MVKISLGPGRFESACNRRFVITLKLNNWFALQPTAQQQRGSPLLLLLQDCRTRNLKMMKVSLCSS